MSDSELTTYEYRGLLLKQSEDASPLVLFAAPATEIARWSAVPQKKQLGGAETTGFQREVNPRRLEALREFYANDKNVIQNPLLLATRSLDESVVAFVPDGSSSSSLQSGTIRLTVGDLNAHTLSDLMRAVMTQLEARVDALQGRTVDPALVDKLRVDAAEAGHIDVDDAGSEVEDDDSNEMSNGNDDSGSLAAVVEDESHILDFWDEMSARVALIEEIGDFSEDSFLGYSKAAMISFLCPATVVDGQHRLEGAIAAANAMAGDTAEGQGRIASLMDDGHSADEAQEQVTQEYARRLPVSLLLTEDPAEHVFQFVIVNQKAQPISRPLLGTIISTTLSNEELQGVSERLEDAGIPLEDSRAVASLTRDERSPFYNLVERGLANESRDQLAWSVCTPSAPSGLKTAFR